MHINAIGTFSYAIPLCEAPSVTPKPSKKNSWEGKPICESTVDTNQNCCCDGYSIESILEQVYENDLANNPDIEMLEKYPCISCSDLETIADRLAVLAFRKEEKEPTESFPMPFE